MSTDGSRPPGSGPDDQQRPTWVVPPDDEGADTPDVPRVGRHAAPSPEPAGLIEPDPEQQPTTMLPKVPAEGDERAWSGFDPDAFGPTSAGEPLTGNAVNPEPSGADLEAALAGSASGSAAGGASQTVAAPTRAQRRAAAAGAPPPRDWVRTTARGVGQTLITLGVVVLLFVVYEVYITDIFSAQKQNAATRQLEEDWENAKSSEAGTAPVVTGTKVVTVSDPNQMVTDPRTRKRTYQTFDGSGFAKIYIPALGSDYVYTIIEGINGVDLETGPGHYTDTQYPGEPGNFAVAGHRVSKGSPFNNLGQLASCDAVVIETKDDWFIYRVLPMPEEVAGWKTTQHAHCAGVAPLTGQYAGIPGREITTPNDYAQVLPVPHRNDATVPKDALRLITLTTCHPQFSDAERMILHGVLVKSYAKANGFLPPELKES